MSASPGPAPRPVLRLPAPPRCATPVAAELASEALLRGQREVLIRHGQSLYRLRHTSNGKLILTK